MNINVRHYWSKTVKGRYAGEYQQLGIELTITAILVPITIYSAITPGLGLFCVGLFVPTLLFALGTIFTAYGIVADHREQRKNSKGNGQGNA